MTDVAVCKVNAVYSCVVSTELSTIVTATLSAPLSSARLNVSWPSAILASAVTFTNNVAVLLLTVNEPVREAPSISALDTPVIV